ncbi:MAG: nucleotide exchange factor GrpE [Spirochaetaceae bacterium]|jgi:molecular chaperone GrpE|nr:nucleotide exchange factor GrpE [Spirochaetaceae bacterium]
MSKHTSHEDELKQGGNGTPEDTEKQASETAGVSAAGAETGCEADKEIETPDPAAQIQVLETKLAEATDQYLRKAAEFENFRKRMNREKQEAIDFANQALLLDLIPIIDDFERAIKSAEGAGSSSPEFTSLYEGIGMIEKRLVSQLENKWGLKHFDSTGEAFDPTRHEAIMMEKSAEISEPVVAEDFIKGYILKDRVVRSAKVKVLMPEESRNSEDAPGEGGAET